MSRILTITLSNELYRRLEERLGAGQIGPFIEHLLLPYARTEDELDAGYAAMAADVAHEAEALAWVECCPDDGTNGDGDRQIAFLLR